MKSVNPHPFFTQPTIQIDYRLKFIKSIITKDLLDQVEKSESAPDRRQSARR